MVALGKAVVVGATISLEKNLPPALNREKLAPCAGWRAGGEESVRVRSECVSASEERRDGIWARSDGELWPIMWLLMKASINKHLGIIAAWVYVGLLEAPREVVAQGLVRVGIRAHNLRSEFVESRETERRTQASPSRGERWPIVRLLMKAAINKDGVATAWMRVQGHLAHKKTPPPRDLQ